MAASDLTRTIAQKMESDADVLFDSIGLTNVRSARAIKAAHGAFKYVKVGKEKYKKVADHSQRLDAAKTHLALRGFATNNSRVTHGGSVGLDFNYRPIEHMTPDEIEAEIAAITAELERRAAEGTGKAAKPQGRKKKVGKGKRQPD